MVLYDMMFLSLFLRVASFAGLLSVLAACHMLFSLSTCVTVLYWRTK